MKTKKKLWIYIVLLTGNILFIWGNSLLPGSLSGMISGWVRDLLSSIISGGTPEAAVGHGLVRKLAHFAEFTCLGGLLYLLFYQLKRSPWLALPCGVLVAAIDETIQIFVPGRGPGLRDVAIDSAGVALGMILLLVGYAIKGRKKQATEDTNV